MKTIQLLACSIAFASMLGAQAGGLGSVEGQVVSGGDGTPVRRAVVSLQRSYSTGMALPGQPPSTPPQQYQAETDDQGRFAFRDVEAGGYRIMVQHQGFVNQNGLPAVQLWLGEGQQLKGYVVRITPQSVIAGKVLDENGDPVMGAQVYAQRAGTVAGGRPVIAGSAQSNDLGEFRIANLSAGDYVVSANYRDQSRINYAPNQPQSDKPQLVYAPTYHPGTAVAREAETVHVRDGGGVVGGVDIKLAKVEGYSIHVTVNDPGSPVNGAMAYPNLRPRDPATLPGGSYFASMRQPDGTFLFTGVPPGSYVVTAQRSIPRPLSYGGLAGAAASASLPVEVRDGNLEGIVLELKPNADLEGAVRFDPQGACNAGNMSVNLRPGGTMNGSINGPMPQPAQVGADMRFTLKSVAPGEYTVNVNGALNRCYVKSVAYGGQTAPGGVLTVGDSGSLEIVMGSYNAQLSVLAVDGGGNPVPGARIIAVPKDAAGNVGQSGSMTSQSGMATMGSLRPGTYDVYALERPDATTPIYGPNMAEVTRAYEGRGKTVTVGETGRSSVQVTVIPASETGAAAAPPPGAKGSLAGKVVNAVNGAAIAGAVVTLHGALGPMVPGREPSATTDDQGRFSFADLAPGSYRAAAMAPRFIEAVPGTLGNPPGEIVGEGQQVSAYMVKLVPEGVIAGTVKDESGEPVLGARVQIFSYRNQVGERRLMMAGAAQTDDLGRYRIFNLSAADYYVAVERVASPRNTMAIGSDVFVNDAAAEPVSPTTAQTLGTPDSITGPLPAEAETDYAPMWYPNAAQFSAAAAVRLRAGATVENIDMTWRRTKVVRLRGAVVDAAGGAVGTPALRLMPKGEQAMLLAVGSQRVARDGTFEISGVPAGSYTLMAWPGAPGGRGVTGVAANGPVGVQTRMAVQPIEVKDASIQGIKLELSAGRTIKGSFRVEGGGLVSRINFLSLRSQEGAGAATINMGNDGTFTVHNVLPLVYTLNAQNLAANTYVKSVRYGGKDLPLTGFELTGEGELEVVLSNTAAVLEGSIAGADGMPAGLAGVVVAPRAGPSPARTGNADANGNFYFANLPPGIYRVFAWDASSPEGSDPPEDLAPYEGYAKTVTLGDSAHEKVQVTVVPAAR